MRRKVLFGIDYTDSEFIKLVLYLFVGGTAALVEWALFYIFLNYVLNSFGLGLTASSTYSVHEVFIIMPTAIIAKVVANKNFFVLISQKF